MTEKKDTYEYHKQNDYPGERVAEKKRVADRKIASDKKADARVAAKGRIDEDLMDAEVRRSTAKARRVSRQRDAGDAIVITVILALILVIVIGFIGGYMAFKNQADKIDALNTQLAGVGIINHDNVRLSDEEKQIQLYKDFIVLGNDVRSEITALEDYDLIYSDTYQLCSSFTERENSINHALYRFAEKKIVYYDQIAVLAEKTECKPHIQDMRWTMVLSKVADETLYVETKKVCDEITNDTNLPNSAQRSILDTARLDADNKAQTFNDAEQTVVRCLA